MVTNVCETCGNGKFTVTHHEAAHRCPVCVLLEDLKDAEQGAAEAVGLRQDVTDKDGEISDLELKVSRLEDTRDDLMDQVADLEKQVKELEAGR